MPELTSETSVRISDPPKIPSPLLAIKKSERIIAEPIDSSNTIEILVTPLFTEQLPVVESMFGVPVGVSTKNKKEETVIKWGGGTYENSSIIARISRRGKFPHKRSFNWMEQDTTNAEVAVIGGREYSGISTKGGDFDSVYLTKDTNYQSGISIHGLVTEDIAQRMVKTSNWLLSKGIDAEVVWGVSRPERYPVSIYDKSKSKTEIELETWEEYKERLLVDAERNNYSKPADSKVDIPAAREYLESIHPVIINRATTVPFRLSDLPKPFVFAEKYSNKENPYTEFAYMMNHMISYLNRNLPLEKLIGILEHPNKLSSKSFREENIKQLSSFFSYFSDNLGTQIGKLHNEGVTHGYLHSGNITGDGTFVDLDSPDGPPLGGEPKTPTEFAKDINRVLRSIFEVTDELHQAGVLSYKDTTKIGMDFLSKYLETRQNHNPASDRDFIGEVNNIFGNRKRPPLRDIKGNFKFRRIKNWHQEVLHGLNDQNSLPVQHVA